MNLVEVIPGTKLDCINTIKKVSKNILYPQSLKLGNIKYEFSSDRDLITLLIYKNINNIKIIYNYKLHVNEYDIIIAMILKPLNIKYIIYSPNGSSYKELPQIKIFERNINIINLNTKLEMYKIINSIDNKDHVLIISTHLDIIDDIKKHSKDNIDSVSNWNGKWDKAMPQILISPYIIDEFYNGKFKHIIIYKNIELINYLGIINQYKITKNELNIYTGLLNFNDSSILFLETMYDMNHIYRDFISKVTFDAILSGLVNNININWNKNVINIEMDLGIVDKNYRLTNIGNDIYKYSNDIYAGLFYYYWGITYNNLKYIYPALVVTVMLEVLPSITPNVNTITTFHDFIEFWITMTNIIPITDGNSINISKYIDWTINNYPNINIIDLELILKSLRQKMIQYTVQVYGKFSLNGLVDKVLPIFTRIFTLYQVSLLNNKYIDKDGAIIKLEHITIYSTLAILKRRYIDNNTYIAYITLPLLEQFTEKKIETIQLEPISSNILTESFSTTRNILVLGPVPAPNLVGSLNLI